MRKFILPVLLCIIFINPATANDEINSLLKTLDKALKYKLDYAEQKQEQIDSLKIELKLHHKIRKKVQIAELLCFAYSSFQKDSALTYAIHMNELAQESGDGELIIEAKLDLSLIHIYLWPLSNVPAHTEAEVYGDSLPSHQEYPTGIFLPDG